jgi:hypothetical protein
MGGVQALRPRFWRFSVIRKHRKPPQQGGFGGVQNFPLKMLYKRTFIEYN